MKPEVKTAAYHLLQTLSKEEVNELIKVLDYFNNNCKESKRAKCLKKGCKHPSKPLLEQKTAGSTSIYVSGGQSVCPCCKR